MRTGTTGWLIAAVLVSACEQSAKTESQPEMAATAGVGKSWRDPQPPVDPPANQPPAGPAFVARATDDRVRAEGRGADQQSNLDYIQRTAPWVLDYIASGQADQKILHDPYRIDWGQTRGMEQDIEFLNRYGAKLRGKLWGPKVPYTDPLTGMASAGPFPALVFMPGAANPTANTVYDGLAGYEPQLQQLAESGYIVLAVSPQGQGGSEHFEPPHPMCDPQGAWKLPQELGLRELGECAGHHGPVTYSGKYSELYNVIAPVAGPPDPAVLYLADDEEGLTRLLADNYDSFRPRFVFAALDATDWLLSDANPWRGLVNPERLGMLGHSAGADAALVVVNGDPARRFGAAASWDGYGLPPDTVEPRLPTLLMRGESQNVLGPYVVPPSDHLWPAYRNYRRFADEDQHAMLITLRGSTHLEWQYVPYALINPVAPLFNASSKGGQISHYYTLAWFDRWLKGPQYVEDARRRLLARSFDASADRTSIGSGTYDFATQSNVPYRLEGEDVSEHLSVFYLSQIAFDGVSCNDMQAGCGGN